MLHVSYCSKSRTNAISSFQFLEPIDEEESNTKTTSICACGGQGPSNIFYACYLPSYIYCNFTKNKKSKMEWNKCTMLGLLLYTSDGEPFMNRVPKQQSWTHLRIPKYQHSNLTWMGHLRF